MVNRQSVVAPVAEREYVGWSPSPQPARIGEHDAVEWDWYPRRLKSGKVGRSLHCLPGPWFTRLHHCENCGCLGSPRKVSRRYLYCYALGINHEFLCMRCWNRLRRLIAQHDELVALSKIIGKLRRQKREQRENNRGPAGTAVSDNG